MLDTWGFLEKGVIGMRHEKSIVACISIDQNKAHRQIELEAFVVIDVSHEIEGLVNFIEPPVTFQGNGEWEIEIRTRRTEAMVAKNELGIVKQQGVQLLVFEIEMRCHGSIGSGIIHRVLHTLDVVADNCLTGHFRLARPHWNNMARLSCHAKYPNPLQMYGWVICFEINCTWKQMSHRVMFAYRCWSEI